MSAPTIAVAASFRDEANALPGFLEMATSFFNEVFLADCSMDMTPSTDGSLDIIRKWGLPHPPLWNLSNGFGAVRSQLLNSVKSDWCVVMDIDERMGVTLPELRCEGTDRYPAQQHPKLIVTDTGRTYHHRDLLNAKIAEAEQKGIRAVRFSRRHWFGFGMKQPCENWMLIRDFQMRCMKSKVGMGFTTIPRMHERAWDSNTGKDPDYIEDDPMQGPFIDHYHLAYKKMEPEQRKADIAAYDALDKSDKHTPIPA